MSGKVVQGEVSAGPGQAKMSTHLRLLGLILGRRESSLPKEVDPPEIESGPSPLYMPVLLF